MSKQELNQMGSAKVYLVENTAFHSLKSSR